MSTDLLLWLPLAVKLIATAAIVVGASVIAERVGALTGALVATLPVTIWPAFVFISLDHDAIYLSQAVLSGLVINAVTGLFLLLYSELAQKHGLFVSLTVSAACWVSLAALTRSFGWTLAEAALLNLAIYPASLWLSSSRRNVAVPRVPHAWYDLPTRTFLVCALMATLLEISHWAGPNLTGIVAVYPISITSIILILQPRIGGRATAAVCANSLWSLLGISVGLAALYLSIPPFGAVLSLAEALAIPIVWNLTVWSIHRRATSVAISSAQGAQ